MPTSNVVWISLDPVRRKVDFYPKAISGRIEFDYQKRNIYSSTKCDLGSDFFNATIHFHPNGVCCQTTKGLNLTRNGLKKPGYRSVRRIILEEGQKTIILYSKLVSEELRITDVEVDSQITFNEIIPLDVIIDSDNYKDIRTTINIWKPEDLTSGLNDTNVIVWQWYMGIIEEPANLNCLNDNCFVPYTNNLNEEIEKAYQSQENTIIKLPIIGERHIEFIHGTCYAKQKSLDGLKVRIVRRVVTSIDEVIIMFNRMSTRQIDINQILENLPDETIPHHYYCPIFQDIMKNPVTTVDGHIYDEKAILTWFEHKNTSPLTGLPLPSKTLVRHSELKKEIDAFLRSLSRLIIDHQPQLPDVTDPELGNGTATSAQ